MELRYLEHEHKNNIVMGYVSVDYRVFSMVLFRIHDTYLHGTIQRFIVLYGERVDT